MMPPICCICQADIEDDEGDLITFAQRPSDIEWDEKMERTGMAGHPPYMRWFCPEHLPAAQALKHLTVDKAMAQLNQ